MLDIGWGELLVVGVIALIVVGPKDLPGLFRTVGNFMGRARGMAREFQRSMEAAADESGLKDAAQSLKSIDRLNLGSSTSSARKYAESLVKGVDTAVGDASGAGSGKPASAARPAGSAKAAPAPSDPPAEVPQVPGPDAEATAGSTEEAPRARDPAAP